MKDNRLLVSEIVKDIKKDMSDEEVLSLLAGSKISVDTAKESKKSYTFGQRAADKIAKFAGSWAFIFSFVGVLVLWMLVNVLLGTRAFDGYPFILLNLVLSCVAAIQAPLIMMSQNRQEEKDRRRAENDYKVNLKTEILIEDLHNKVNRLLVRQEQLEKLLKAAGIAPESAPKPASPRAASDAAPSVACNKAGDSVLVSACSGQKEADAAADKSSACPPADTAADPSSVRQAEPAKAPAMQPKK